MKKSFWWAAILVAGLMAVALALAGCGGDGGETPGGTEVGETTHSFYYNPEKAKEILEEAGYKDVDGDGFVEAPDGSKISLKIAVPFGWTDWMESINVISEGCKAVGINLQTDFPDYGGYADARNAGKFDMLISNEAQMADTVWAYYDWVFRSPITENMTRGNYGRYDNPEIFDLVSRLDRTPKDDIAGMKEICKRIQEIQLEDMPIIPLWYNGLWSQVSTAVWENWPSSAPDTPTYLPATWRGYWNMGAILMLTELKAKEGVDPGTGTYPRNETLYTSGTLWGPPSNWNPLVNWDYATGTLGLCYETLFLYDPLAGEYIPWLAESGTWTGDKTYELKVRKGIKWSDGKPLTAEDVKFTFELGEKYPSVYFSIMWDWLDEVVKLDEYTLQFNFSEALYQEWGNYLYTTPILPKHLWENRGEQDIAFGINENPVGSGAYLYETHSADRMVWVRNENWWAKELLGLEVAPKYIVDIINPSNNVALGMLLQGDIDLSNNFLPGIAGLLAYNPIQTFYPEPPYMIGANTAWLVMNLQKAPMDDPAFRKAVAHAIDVSQIVEVVYGNIVSAAHPTGLLPIWSDLWMVE